MKTFFLCGLGLFFQYLSLANLDLSQELNDPIQEYTKNMKSYSGYYDFWWEEKTGKIWLKISNFEEEFLYVNSLAAGLGSNDIGLDRGQLGRQRIVKFVRVGPKVLLLQPNYKYRANSDNQEEKRAVTEAFAQSVLWDFKVAKENDKSVLVDATNFFLHDAHGVAGKLKANKQGSYVLDPGRSVIYLPGIFSFPKNAEFEVLITFRGTPEGDYVKSVTPSPEAVSLRLHHSFVELPDEGYEPRVFDPRSGYYSFSYTDYATPIDQPLTKRFINRHRLQKKNPQAKISEAVKPIIYYLDPGTPEPIRSALLEGARWWEQAFEVAGYKDAFKVQMLPVNAHPLDVRYNVIQWVHRSTRGWSYGATVTDPRTGEIIKGHVSLGSLRVRQDYLIAQGLTSPFKNNNKDTKPLIDLALMRLRQLSAHEVGHTLGLTHNFAASVNGRASVMDYPHPYVELTDDGQIDFSNAYDVGIGEWDKRSIMYGYQDFPEEVDEQKALQQMIRENIDEGLLMISDQDARPAGGAHAFAHLWDNGSNSVAELKRLIRIRKIAMEKFGLDNLPEGHAVAELEEILVPLYLAQRYQVEAVAKLIGGLNYTYAVKGDNQNPVSIISAKDQRVAIKSLIEVLTPEILLIPEPILKNLPPKPFGYKRGRESFKHHTGVAFDPVAAAESVIYHTLGLILHPERAARLVIHKNRDANMPGLDELIDQLIEASWKQTKEPGITGEIGRSFDRILLEQLMSLSINQSAMAQVRAIANYKIYELKSELEKKANSVAQRAHQKWALELLRKYQENPEELNLPKPIEMPAGSPIGMGCE